MTNEYSKTRLALRSLFDAATEAVSANVAMPKRLPHSKTGKTLIIGAGKGAAAMTQIACTRIKGDVSGLVVTRYGHGVNPGAIPRSIEVIEASHPVPDSAGEKAAIRALKLAHDLGRNDHLLMLISGGASALLTLPVPGITLVDKQKTTKQLLASGATILEINCVRKHLSLIKGGRLALAASPAKVSTFLISDVPGDDPSFVGSGPTIADHTTLEQARKVLKRYQIEANAAVITALNNPDNETPGPDVLELAGNEVRIIAKARDALNAAANLAAGWGYNVTDLGDDLQAESRHLGAEHAALARRLSANNERRVIISGGETTVTVKNKSGRGGRNLEYLLGLAIGLDGAPNISAIACDTDGIDGTENNAGAIITPDTLTRARKLGHDPRAYLSENDCYTFFDKLGDLVITGPTRTNTNDFRAIIIDPDQQ